MSSQKHSVKSKKKILIVSFIALLVLAILSLFFKYTLENFIREQTNFSKVINIAGKQRMLSQRVMLLIQSMNMQKQNDGYQIIRSDLLNCLRLMKKSIQDLTNGNTLEGIAKITNSEIERNYYGKTNLYQRTIDFIEFAETSANNYNFTDFLFEYNIYKVNSLLNDLDKMVTLYINESNTQLNKIIAFNYLIFYSIIFVIFFEFFIIFKPLSAKIYNKFKELEIQIYNLKNDKSTLEIETRSAQRALGNIVPRVEYIDQFNTESVQLASYYQSAKGKGDDWWGIYEFDKTKIVLLGDVSGHEAGSALIAAAVSNYFEELSNQKSIDTHDFLDIFKFLNEFIQKIGNPKMSMSMEVLIFNENLDRVKFINAAHSFPYHIHYKDNGEIKITRFKSRGHIIGYKNPVTTNPEFDEELKVVEYEFKENSMICLFSNGLTGNTDKEEQDFGEKNLKKFFEKNNFKNTSVIKVVDKLIDEAYSFYEENPITDDITFILMKRVN